jgi:hypothetical protein
MGNFDMSIFLNSSRLFKDFRKIEYAMPCHAMHPMQYYFWKVFHMLRKLRCNLYVLLYRQNFILGKCGCYINKALMDGAMASTSCTLIPLKG